MTAVPFTYELTKLEADLVAVWQGGFDSYRLYVPQSDNPWSPIAHRLAHKAWNAGWCRADEIGEQQSTKHF